MTDRPLPAIDVRDQARLPLRRTFQLCLAGIRHRFFRSLLTSAVIVLAVAFFMTLLAGSVFARAVAGGTAQERAEVRLAPDALERWFGRPAPAAVARALERGGAADLARRTGQGAEALAGIAADCRDQAAVLAWFDALDVGARVVLVRSERGAGILAWLADDARWESFAARLAANPALRPPLPPEELRRVARRADGLARDLADLARAQGAAAARLEAAVEGLVGAPGPEARLAWLARADAAALAAFAGLLSANGLDAPDAAGMARLQQALRRQARRDAVAAALSGEEARTAWRRAFQAAPSVEEKLRRVDDPRAAPVLAGAFPAEELAAVAREARAEARLDRVEDALAGKVPEDGALVSTRQLLLVAISFVVCMVGIANAMLMAITERFREIATMKCLGATDGYILAQFMMEAALQGAAGGALGTVLGLVLAVAKDGWAYGGHLAAWFPWGGAALCALACLAAGMALSVLASIYPSWLASRMAPMDAMRVE